MNGSKYKNDLPYPVKQDYQTEFWYRAGKCVAQRKHRGEIQTLDDRVGSTEPGGIELGACTRELLVDEEAFRAAKRAHGARTSELEVQFKQDLFVELGIVDHPKADKLYSLAWQYGHSAGYDEVITYAWDLVDLIKD